MSRGKKDNLTSIVVWSSTRERLRNMREFRGWRGLRNESYDDVINRLLDEIEKASKRKVLATP